MFISKKLRFEVFKRDNFTCGYCGRTPPEITLEIDHINPKSKGGKNDINNYLTSCFDCNRGKQNIPLTVIPNSLTSNLEILKEKEIQLKEYNKFIKKIEKRLENNAILISNIYNEYFSEYCLSEQFKQVTLKRFQKNLALQEIIDAMRLACSKINQSDNSIKYFCGICWNKIKAKTDPLHTTKIKLKKYWEFQPRGSGYIKKGMLEKWLNRYSEEQIKQAMDNASGHWAKLRDKLGE